PTIAWLASGLPLLPKEGNAEPGLYVDLEHAPAVALEGRVRVSVLRLFSVTDGKPVLVGQVQATRDYTKDEGEWQMHRFVHIPAFFVSLELNDDADWFLRVLDMHYGAGGALVSFPAAVQA
ncbi:MAG: hypothetical protein ACREI7_10675, partial [Myxococcota bacterium]